MSKSKTIRLKDLKQGVTIYEVRSGEVRSLLVMSRPYKKHESIAVDIQFQAEWRGRPELVNDKIFMGDSGVPGAAYDNRPCSLYRTKRAAVQGLSIHEAYAHTLREETYADDYYELDDHRDFYEQDEKIFRRQASLIEEYREPRIVEGYIHETLGRPDWNRQFRVDHEGSTYYGVARSGRRVRFDFRVKNGEVESFHTNPIFLLKTKQGWYEPSDVGVWLGDAEPAEPVDMDPSWTDTLNRKVQHLID